MDSLARGKTPKRGESFIVKKTPAVTIVAAWMRALTGVGPSIASGNQVCKPNWALFPLRATKKHILAIRVVLWTDPFKIHALIILIEKVP